MTRKITTLKGIFESQKIFDVLYDNIKVGRFMADLVVSGLVIVELKAVESHNTSFEAQLLNYLRASKLDVGLLINFERTVKIKRMVL